MPLKILLFTTLFFCVSHLNAQESSPSSLGIEAGLTGLFDSDRLGLFLHIEPKHRVSENAVIGLRLGATINTQTIVNTDLFQFDVSLNENGQAADNGVFSITPTFDYYLKGDNYRPYAGFGVGYYLLASYIEVSRTFSAPPSDDVFKVSINNQVGLLLRGGIESNKLRLGVEYNFVPQKDIVLPDGAVVGFVDKSYLGLSVGVRIGKKRNN